MQSGRFKITLLIDLPLRTYNVVTSEVKFALYYAFETNLLCSRILTETWLFRNQLELISELLVLIC